eukprot:jgi/Mesvir1/2498/Mv25503-RA.1
MKRMILVTPRFTLLASRDICRWSSAWPIRRGCSWSPNIYVGGTRATETSFTVLPGAVTWSGQVPCGQQEQALVPKGPQRAHRASRRCAGRPPRVSPVPARPSQGRARLQRDELGLRGSGWPAAYPRMAA